MTTNAVSRIAQVPMAAAVAAFFVARMARYPSSTVRLLANARHGRLALSHGYILLVLHSLRRSRRSGESGSQPVYTHLAGHARIILRWLRASSRYSPGQCARSRFSPDAMLQFRLHQCRKRRDNLPALVSQQTI